jgi:peroxiredoxin
MTVELGDRAPDFALPRSPGEPAVRLADYLGTKNVVLLFFPLAWSSVCTAELCSVRDDHAAYAGLDAEVLGVSVDSPYALSAWAREQGFPFPLLSDFNRDVSRSYGALYDDFHGLAGVSKRAAFVVDKRGVIRHREVLEDARLQPDFAAVRAVLAGLD